MELTAQTINIVLLILPGLVGLRFYSLLSGSEPESLWRHSIDTLIFTLVIYVPLEYFGFWAPIVQLDSGTLAITIADPKIIGIVLVAALVLAALYSLATYTGLVSFVLRSLRLTRLTHHETAWHDVMSKRKYLKVICKDGETLFGWPRYYSLCPDYGFIYLQNCYIFDDGIGDWNWVSDADGILLDYANVESIEVSSVKPIGKEVRRGFR